MQNSHNNPLTFFNPESYHLINKDKILRIYKILPKKLQKQAEFLAQTKSYLHKILNPHSIILLLMISLAYRIIFQQNKKTWECLVKKDTQEKEW